MDQVKTIRKRDLVQVIEEFGNFKAGEASKIIDTMFKTITHAMRSGKVIKVAGFGIFDTYVRAPTRCPVSYFLGYNFRHIYPERKIIELPAKTIPRFTPSKLILRQLNQVERSKN